MDTSNALSKQKIDIRITQKADENNEHCSRWISVGLKLYSHRYLDGVNDFIF